MRANVVDRADLSGVSPDTRLLVRHHGVVIPAVPQLSCHLKEFRRPLVATGVGRLVLHTEVPGGLGPCGGHYIPAGPATADEVHGREAPSQVKRIVVRR